MRLWPRIRRFLPDAFDGDLRRAAVLGAIDVALSCAPVGLIVLTLYAATGTIALPDLTIIAWLCPPLVAATLLVARAAALAQHRIAFGLGHALRRAIVEKCRRLPLARLRKLGSGTVTALLNEEIRWIEGYAMQVVGHAAADFGVPAALTVMLAILDWRLALAVILAQGAALAVAAALKRVIGRVIGRRAAPLAEIAGRLGDFADGMPVLRSFGRVADSQRRIRTAIDDLHDIYLRSQRKEIPLFALAGLCLDAGMALVLLFAAWRLEAGELSPPTFVAAILLTLLIFTPVLQQLGGAIVGRFAEAAEAAVDRFMREPEIGASTAATPPADNTLRLQGVGFAYGGGAGPAALRDIDLEIPVGGVTAIVGPSGAGKSTLLALLARFHDPDAGRITLGGTDLRTLPESDLMARFAIVLQDEHLFDASIADNIRLGRPEASADELEAAARLARCHDFIRSLPQGYATPAGDRGKALSGGERQRTAIARAILKDAPIVLFDEPTSAVDPIASAAIQSALSALARGRTLVVVAHHLSAVRRADRIVVMNQGRIEAVGSHPTLLQDSPTYARLWACHASTLAWHIPNEGFQPRTGIAT